MKIRFKGWESEGLRSPDVRLELIQPHQAKTAAILIQMPNGTGKTSTLELLKATLSGTAKNWNREQIEAFRPSSDQRDSGIDIGSFRCFLLLDDRELMIEMNLNFGTGLVKYISVGPDLGGKIDGYKVPQSARWFFEEQFLDLVIFDGEFASNLLDKESSVATAAVSTLAQLYRLQDASRYARGRYKELIDKREPAGSKAQLKQEKNKLNFLNERKSEVEEKEKKLAKKATDFSVRINNLEQEKKEEASSLENDRLALEELESDFKSAEDSIRNTERDLASIFRIPALVDSYFKDDLDRFLDGLETAKLPPSISKQFFVELVEKDDCICGRKLTSVEKEYIRDNTELYLGEETVGVLNLLKSQIGQNAQMRAGLSRDFKTLIRELDEKEDKQLQARSAMQEFVDSRSKGVNSSQREAVIAKLKVELDNTEKLLEMFKEPKSSSSDDKLVSIPEISRRIAKLEESLARRTNSVVLNEKTQILESICEDALKRANLKIKGELVEKGNSQLSKILRRSPLKIKKIEDHVVLEGQDGASSGQKLSVGYVLMGLLLERGSHSIPFFVDSPANSIDPGVSREIATIIPELCDQFIGLVIGTDRDDFVKPLCNASPSYQLLTLFKNTQEDVQELSSVPSDEVTTTKRFSLVKSEKFFWSFDRTIDDEDE